MESIKSQEKEMETEKQKQKRKSDRRRLYLLTYPRTASHLLQRILALEKQPNVAPRERGGYFFLPLMKLRNHQLDIRGKHVEEWTQDERARVMQCYQNCFDELEAHVAAAEAQDKIVFIKEHSNFMTEPTARTRFLFGQDSVKESPWTVQVPTTYGSEMTHSTLNETVLPDEFLRTWLPTFLIRHPGLVFPSHYRTIIDNEGVEAAASEEIALGMTLHWSRTLYDWYAQHLSKSEPESRYDSDITWPIVLDADDIITGPEVVVRLCEIVGLDATKLQFTWAPASEEELAQLDPVERRMKSTITASASVIGGKTSANLNIDAEAKQWREEFGEREGEKMERWVRAAIPDYEFMKARRLRPKLA